MGVRNGNSIWPPGTCVTSCIFEYTPVKGGSLSLKHKPTFPGVMS